MDQLLPLIPESLREVSGVVFNSGREAFIKPSPLYVLGLNPGGDPAAHMHETVWSHSQAVAAKSTEWSAYRDNSWDGRAPGTAPLQRSMLHLLGNLGLNPGQVPMSNLVFKRSRDEASIRSEIPSLVSSCWPLHRAVISSLGTKVILCFERNTGKWVRQMTGATRKVDEIEEKNLRKIKSFTHVNDDGLAVVTVLHGSRFAWHIPASDPTELVRRALALNSRQ